MSRAIDTRAASTSDARDLRHEVVQEEDRERQREDRVRQPDDPERAVQLPGSRTVVQEGDEGDLDRHDLQREDTATNRMLRPLKSSHANAVGREERDR